MVHSDVKNDNAPYAFMEVNPRLQVEHTVTEEVTGIDIVKTQLQLAAGNTLEALHLGQDNVPEPRGYAVQTRINMETIGEDGTALPAQGRLSSFDVPSGRGIRPIWTSRP